MRVFARGLRLEHNPRRAGTAIRERRSALRAGQRPERSAPAVRRAESNLGRPVTVRDVRDEIDMDPSLRPAGSSALHYILSDFSKTQIAGTEGEQADRITQRMVHVGTVRRRAYYAAERVEEG